VWIGEGFVVLRVGGMQSVVDRELVGVVRDGRRWRLVGRYVALFEVDVTADSMG
jgi:hypothetical protein